MKKEQLKKVAIEKVQEIYRSKLLAIYERGSAFTELTTKTSDYDLQVVIKTEKSDLMKGVLFATTQKINEEGVELDLAIVSEYKLVNQIQKSIINVTELLFKEPIYVAEEFSENARYLKEKAYPLLMINKDALAGCLYGYYKTYVIKVEKEIVEKGKPFNGKSFAMALRFKNLASPILLSLPEEILSQLMMPKGEYKNQLMEIRNKELLTTSKELTYFSQLKSELISYETVLKVRLSKSKKSTNENISALETELLGKLLPPV